MKNLKEQNLRLEEEVRLLKAEQQSILHRVDVIERAIRKKPVQVDNGVGTVQEESSDDESYIYSPIYSPANSMPPLYQTPAHVGQFPPYFPLALLAVLTSAQHTCQSRSNISLHPFLTVHHLRLSVFQ